jgi:hypothetical protein
MHLRGPMNISQLAVYQLPDDMHTLRKRNTVPFYNRQRALPKRDANILTRDHARGFPLSPAVDGRTLKPIIVSYGPRTATTSSSDLGQPATLPHPNKHDAHTNDRRVFRRAAADWGRVGYYTSTAPAQATGLSFLANLGDPLQSGTFD